MYKHGVDMKARVQKWGNSLGVRIPRALAREASVDADTEVDITSQGGKIVITPIRRKAYTLRQLLSRITEENLHGEVDTGAPVGQEGW